MKSFLFALAFIAPHAALADEACGLLTGGGSVFTLAETTAPKQPKFLSIDDAARNKLAAFNDTYVCIRMARIEYGGPAFNYVRAEDFEIRKDESVRIRDVRASSCEVFIDKAMVIREARNPGSMSARTIVELMLKTDPARLDGKVVKVAFFGNVEDTTALAASDGVSPLPGPAQTLLGGEFVQAEDYFHLPLFPVAYDLTRCSSHGCTDHAGKPVFTGSFYVQTDKGTRYWANAASGEFTIDLSLANSIATSFPSFGAQDIGRVPKTADEATGGAAYLNPQRCR